MKMKSLKLTFRQTSNISRTVVGKNIVGHSVYRRCSNYILIPDLNLGFNGQLQGETRIVYVLEFGAFYIRSMMECDKK